MYLNDCRTLVKGNRIGLTVTLDVFKFAPKYFSLICGSRLTVTLDVFKFF